MALSGARGETAAPRERRVPRIDARICCGVVEAGWVSSAANKFCGPIGWTVIAGSIACSVATRRRSTRGTSS